MDINYSLLDSWIYGSYGPPTISIEDLCRDVTKHNSQYSFWEIELSLNKKNILIQYINKFNLKLNKSKVPVNMALFDNDSSMLYRFDSEYWLMNHKYLNKDIQKDFYILIKSKNQ